MKRFVLPTALASAAIAVACSSAVPMVDEPKELVAGPGLIRKPNSECTVATCNGNGTCAVVSGVATCTCRVGYVGATCDECMSGLPGPDGKLICPPACDSSTCSSHGTCDDSSGTASCTCEASYTGWNCGTCATGFQDNDANGTCTASCAASTCNHHGTCSDAAGTVACTCTPPYSGETCAISPTCQANTCNSHGTCVDTTGTAVCTCSAGYAGANCADCATGFQDNDEDNSCAPACAANTCGAHGSCVDTTGTAVCTCATGYTGPSCAACSAGFQDKDNNGTCTDACGATTCNAHGACSDTTGSAVCTCSGNYAGATCATCATGFQDNDDDDTCTAACAAGTCNAHGTCSDASGATVCTCALGYTGATCATCATGFQDNDDDNTCSAVCAAGTCNAHGTCSDATGTATCSCSRGFAGPACNACAPNFTGAACDTCVAGKGGPNCNFDLVLGLNIPTTSDYDVPTDVLYDYDDTATPGAFTRVAYRLVLGTQEVWVEMDAFTANKFQLGVPVDWVFDRAITNVTVISKAANTPSVSVPTNGSMEFWSHCYGTNGGNNALYDYDDERTTEDCYGSMQIHIGTNTVFAFNRWSAAAPADLGFGNQTVGHPDWTLTSNAASYATRRLEVFVK